MVALADLRRASFRGAGFLVPSDQTEEGRHSIIHQYPDSPLRYVEDNGYCPPEFHVTAVLHGRGLLSQFSALRSALNRPGPGTLHHPYYGTQFVAVIGPWKVKREDKDAGVLELDIKFAVTGPAVFPGNFGSISAVVTGLASTLISSAFAAFAARYGNPVLSPASFAALNAGTVEIGETVLTKFGSIATAQIPASHLVTYPERYVADGDLLANALQSVLRAPLDDPAVTYDGARIVVGMAAIDQAALAMQAVADKTPTTTKDYVVRKQSLESYSVFVRIGCLSSMADAMAGTTYVTVESVHAAARQINRIYQSIPLEVLPHDLGQSVADLVAATLGVLHQQELQLPHLSLLDVNEYPASVLAYMLYEDDRNPASEPHLAAHTSTLVNLNSSQSPVLLNGPTHILRTELA